MGEPLPVGLSVDLAKDYLDLQGVGVDARVERVLRGVVAFAERRTHRRLHPLPADPDGDGPPVAYVATAQPTQRWIRVPEARTVSAVAVDGVATSEWELRGDRGGVCSWVYLLGPTGRRVGVTGRFGFSPLPDDLLDAILAHTARCYHERAAAYADVVEDVQSGTSHAYFRTMPPRVRAVYDSWIPGSQKAWVL